MHLETPDQRVMLHTLWRVQQLQRKQVVFCSRIQVLYCVSRRVT